MPRDLNRAIERIEERIFRKPLGAPPNSKPAAKDATRTWHAADAKPRVDALVRQAAADPRRDGVLTARSIQLKIVVAPEQVLRLPVPDGQPRIRFSVAYDGGVLSVDVAAKSVRKAQSTIHTTGVANTFVMLQGKLGRGEILECGLIAQPKTPPNPPAG
jgi:hypothetical protein